MFERSTADETTTSGDRTAADRPTRGADRNRDLVDRADRHADDALLPTLDDGITLLDVEGGRGVPALQSLVLDHLLSSDGPAAWVDAEGYATTTTLARIAPSRRLLDRIHVARGFTAYQHFAAVRDLPAAFEGADRRAATAGVDPVDPPSERIEQDGRTDPPSERTAQGDRTDPASKRTGQGGRTDPPSEQAARGGRTDRQGPSLVVAPAVDARYREADSLRDRHAKRLLARTLAQLNAYAERYDVPVLVTRTGTGGVSAPVDAAADRRLTCEHTRMGPRFVGEEFETLVYPVGDGSYRQTTFAYWRRLLRQRAEQVGLEPATPADPSTDPGGVGTGVTADGDRTTLAADPLLDAWTAVGAGGVR